MNVFVMLAVIAAVLLDYTSWRKRLTAQAGGSGACLDRVVFAGRVWSRGRRVDGSGSWSLVRRGHFSGACDDNSSDGDRCEPL